MIELLLSDSDWAWHWRTPQKPDLAVMVMEDLGPHHRRHRRRLEIHFRALPTISYLCLSDSLMVRCPVRLRDAKPYMVSIVSSFLLDPRFFARHLVTANAETEPV